MDKKLRNSRRTGMVRTNFYYPQSQIDRLKQMKAETGLCVSEAIRRAIDEYLERADQLKREGQ
jgi:hypothetical protein